MTITEINGQLFVNSVTQDKCINYRKSKESLGVMSIKSGMLYRCKNEKHSSGGKRYSSCSECLNYRKNPKLMTIEERLALGIRPITGTAEYVVWEAKQRIKHGHNPRLTYRGILNPRKALMQAQREIKARSKVCSYSDLTSRDLFFKENDSKLYIKLNDECMVEIIFSKDRILGNGKVEEIGHDARVFRVSRAI